MRPGFEEPNIERLLAALHHEKADRVPNFEILIDARNLYLASKTPAVPVSGKDGDDPSPCTAHSR